jgi:hypothetical protein
MARRRHKQKERFPLVAVLGWPLVAATPLLFFFVRTGNPVVDPLLHLGFSVPALAAMLWAFTRVSETRKYRTPVLVLLIVAGVEFLGLFLYFFLSVSGGPPEAATQPAPARAPLEPSETRPAAPPLPATAPAPASRPEAPPVPLPG